MFSPQQYQLIDFGDGEKLERFGDETLIRRPSPAADLVPRVGSVDWDQAITFDRTVGWNIAVDQFECQVEHRGIQFNLATTPTGQVGIFPEQVANWDWILDHPRDLSGMKAINLFGYTGGTTMALAQRGVQVTHVDAASSVVAWARENAKLAGLGEAPIRWITEDAIRFLIREIKRGNRYDIVVADPPSFGRGPKKEVWKIQRDLGELIGLLDQLCDHRCQLAILSCHTLDFSSDDLARMVRSRFSLKKMVGEELELSIETNETSPRSLPSGDCFRFAV